MKRTQFTLALICVLGLCAEASAQPAGDNAWSAVESTANNQGHVVVYTDLIPADMDKLARAFMQTHPGIVVEAVRILGPPLVNKLDEERKLGLDGGDVVIGTEVLSWYGEWNRQGLLKAPIGPAAKTWPTEYMLQGNVPVLRYESVSMGYNTDLVKSPISSYQDLLNPDFKGKIGTTEPVAGAIVGWYDWLNKSQGPDYVEKLAAQAPRIYVGAVPIAQATASGEIAVAAFANASTFNPLIASGARIKLVTTSPAFGFRYAGAIVGWSKRPSAAQVFMDYMMSVRGQTAWGGGTSASPLPGIPGTLDIHSITPYDPSQYNVSSIAAYKGKWDAMFKAGQMR